MTEAESLREVAQGRAPFSTWLGIVLLFVLFGAIVLAIVGPMPRGDNYEAIRAKKRAEALKAVRETEKTLASYAWVDKSKGTVRIPIDRAMELTVAELSKKKPTAAGPIALPQPGAQPATSPGAATPAPAPTATAAASPKAKAVAGPQSENLGQPASATNPASAPPGTQPGPGGVGASASPQAAPAKSP